MNAFPVLPADRVLIVAEIGNNHEGRLDTAHELVRRAAAAGADAVKFQTFRTEHFVSRRDEARFARLKSFELGPDDFAALSELAHSLGLWFVSTPLDLASVDALRPIVDAYKVASGDNDFVALLDRVGATNLPVIISSGISDVAIVRHAVTRVRSARTMDRPGTLAVLHAVSAYPTPPPEANLRAIRTLAEALRLPVGFSDHTMGIDAAVLSVACGACVIEKHFTLDTQFSDFRDHRLSADPTALADLVRRVRHAEALLGSGDKVRQPSELSPTAIRRSVAAAADLPAGHVLRMDDLTWIRPAGGIPPGDEGTLLGRALRHAVTFGDQLSANDVA